ncbi:hypothetical protein FKW77_009900 [Venturia effusa]|uniref:Histidine kinase n=1 Tax=Venturia effusa TaxID=50376 RepID=A0A517LEQ6_9PEZI|nr:hypothetical protein FKW77_009900 [Venturia effusa]
MFLPAGPDDLTASRSNPSRRRKKITESKRLRDVFRFCPKELHGYDLSSLLEAQPDLPVPPPGYVAHPSPDSALTAFAQLGALRLGAARALISILDGRNQYILAEATSSLPLRAGRRRDIEKELWLGNVRIPRSAGMCERVLSSPDAVIIDDLAENAAVCDRSYMKDGPNWRFYAGVPMKSPHGAVIGAFCIFDDKPREGLSEDHLDILRDLAETVVEHLATYKLREENRRGERMVRGLTSFLEGASELKPGQVDDDTDQEAEMDASTTKEALQKPPLRRTVTEDSIGPIASNPENAPPGMSEESLLRPPGQTREKSASSILQESILPTNARSMFSRAANIIRETSELDGVVIFDASIAGVGGQQDRSIQVSTKSKAGDENGLPSAHMDIRRSSTTEDTSSDSSTNPHRRERQQCQILGFSCDSMSSVAGDSANESIQSLTEYDLKKLLKLYSKGKIMNFGLTEAMTSSDESTKEDGSAEESEAIQRQSRKTESTKRLMEVIKGIAPGVSSICFLPLWDYDRARWFVGCLFWTNQKDRLLSPTLDLVYLKAFGNSVMTELSRLNAIASNKVKTTFAASISHELRSPLHGILGGVEFLQQSENLDPFQKSMLHSTSICGKTLLDTLNHVMDYAKINEINGNSKSRTQVLNSNSVRVISRPSRKTQATESSNFVTGFDLSRATEEVVEAVFASQSYRVAHSRIDDDHTSQVMDLGANTSHTTVGDDASRKLVHIIIDMPCMENWTFSMPVGAWRRVLMNLFGNALKYTNSGFIRVSLRQESQADRRYGMTETRVVLSVKDTGIGMSPDFLANHLYTAFSQENHLSSGVGLGLNIVRQILGSVGGNIDLTSDVGVGTEVSVCLSLPAVEKSSQDGEDSDSSIEPVRKRAMGRTVCIIDKAVDMSQPEEYSSFATTMASTLEEWLGARAFVTRDSSDLSRFDVVICTEPSFEFLSSIRKQRPVGGKVPVVIFLAIDAIEAAALRTDVRVTSKESVVEIVSQPCGPYKLSRVLEHCMNRYESSDENIALLPNLSPPSSIPTSPQEQVYTLRGTTSPEPPRSLPDALNAGSMSTEGDTPTTNHHILIVDDNAINRRLLIALMKRHKYTYREAVNGLDALQIYKATTSPRFDVVLMDLSMPVMDGMTASAKIRRYEKEQRIAPTTIVALTGLVSASAKLEALESGMDYYLTKPVNFGRLVEVLVDERGRRRRD